MNGFLSNNIHNERYLWKMLQFNQNLLKERDLDYVFSRFSLNSNDLHFLVDGTKKESIRCVDNLSYELENKR